MKKKVRFFQSVNFKIALAFILILLISIEIIGAYFIRGLERSTIKNFTDNMKDQAAALAPSFANELGQKETNETYDNIQRIIENSRSTDVVEIRVVDANGIIMGASPLTDNTLIGKKNDYQDINDLSYLTKTAYDEDTNRRVFIVVQPILSTTGDTVVGALFMKSDIEKQYSEIRDTAFIFVTASLLAAAISIVVAVLVARSITQPIGEMQEQAMRIARGDYSRRVTVYGKDELGQLAETFNQLGERIEETQDAMESERNRLDSVLSHMTDGVIATDRRGKVTSINEMAMTLLNVKGEEVIGESILELLGIEEDYTLRKLLEKPDEMLIHRENPYRGTVILRTDFAMIRRESGFISGLVAVMHDVTEQEKTEQERREFVSNVSHELRTPLTSMRSYIEALSEGAWKDEKIAPNFLKVTLDETDRMIRMINDLLDLSRMDSQQSNLQLEYININELVSFVLDRFDMIMNNEEKGKKYRIRRDFTQRELWAEVDPDKIIQVIDNIMNNAIKYSPDGGTITVHLSETHNNILLSITDQGLGIPKKDLQKVFDRFYRVDKARARKQGGTGLGLAITKEVIKAHGGTIWVESQEGRGSTFYITLPYEPYEEDWWE
ncbi:cell wall metabolism sensor histidine kinase WalK [Enterococcus asini]|uniref:cell wall metabolism sensor histidine kinase WalK n=1 Tax=Enterococcus asini TaxID=57732 RepID=UPI001E2E2FBD|nr:cell wall metabolism sensor histidine kinase WalK [Enterococcus asini]MCD5029837.1 cell wall metabolism sensor histidine kinase WalK [Enterococcus asini]MDT2744408.1 cell wall metabolism sensor histidine kinase WalK [Enterococcus asini]MDT2763307.1 cell wall metabolism sensor histidine kinase WalK [Enterococcus asini]MDT2785083.1 cell wall metabolism sensor histidine kinase WalK [Enterococcus asini]